MSLVDRTTGEVVRSRYQVMPPLTADEFLDLRADIEANGVLQPVLIDECNRIIDGHNRKMIAEALGITCPTIKCPPNLTDEQKRTLAYGLNLHRRHLDREQKRTLITKSLLADPQLSNRQHAERVGVSDKTVGAVRGEMEGRAEIPHVSERTDSTGRQQPASKPPTVTVTERESHSTTTSRPLPPGGAATADVPPPSAVAPSPDPEQQAEIDRREAIERRAKRLEAFVVGWIEFRNLHTNPDREAVLALLTPRDREYIAEAQEAFRHAA